MANANDYTVEYINPSVLRCGQHDCLLLYKDAQGTLDFHGVETDHDSGGVVIFPTAEEWQKNVAFRTGQRHEIRERLCAFLKSNERYDWIPQTLSDGALTSRQAAYVAQHRSRMASIEARASQLRRMGPVRKFLLSPKVQIALSALLGFVVLVVSIAVIVWGIR